MDLLDNEKLMVKYQHCLYMNNMPRQLFPCYYLGMKQFYSDKER